ncbi:MAG: hypothetical protein HOI95_21840 [Chromatiales bacterium]|jgi:hypothetical protein|nr:hypothetical protein [Chromatiales bacterium]
MLGYITIGTNDLKGAGNPEMVQAVHAKALEMGGKDEGAPGPRRGPDANTAR